MCRKWFLRQSFVTCGVTLNFMTHSMVLTFTSVLIPALNDSTEIPLDVDSASWIASIFGIAIIVAVLMVPWSINSFGRKPVHILSSLLMTLGWATIILSSNVTHLLLGRFLQGYSMGILAILGSVLIGEYSSPKYRGALLATISTSIGTGVLIVHSIGTLITWRKVAMICAAVPVLDLMIILYSPESPSYLAMRGKYDECKKVFRWLRGHDEEPELDKLIRTNMARQSKITVARCDSISNRISNVIQNIKLTISKKEVYKPIILALHLYALNLWAGAVVFDVYNRDIIDIVLGKNVNYALVAVSLDIQRIISSILGLITVTKLRRKITLAAMMLLNIFGFLSISLYVYLKNNHYLSASETFIGITLLHIHTFSQFAGAMTLSNIIPGEIYPLRHRGLCGMLGVLFFSVNETIDLKIAPYLLSSIGLSGMYMVHVIFVVYPLVVLLIMLPETKDRTLLEIEEEFRGEQLICDEKLVDSCEDQDKGKQENQC